MDFGGRFFFVVRALRMRYKRKWLKAWVSMSCTISIKQQNFAIWGLFTLDCRCWLWCYVKCPTASKRLAFNLLFQFIISRKVIANCPKSSMNFNVPSIDLNSKLAGCFMTSNSFHITKCKRSTSYLLYVTLFNRLCLCFMDLARTFFCIISVLTHSIIYSILFVHFFSCCAFRFHCGQFEWTNGWCDIFGL